MASLADMKQRGAVANQESGAVMTFERKVQVLKSKIPTLATVAPKHVNAKRIIHSAITQMSKDQKLAECSPLSVYQSVSISIGLGLDIVGGQGYLVPRFNKKKRRLECTFVPGWQGLVDLITRGGRGTVFTGAIYRDQRYTFRDGARRDLEVHNETALDHPDDITHVYAIGWIKGQEIPVIELWPIDKVRKHRDKFNEVGDGHYSFKNWEMYARKVPLLQVIKYMPKTQELVNALEANDAVEKNAEYVIDGEGLIDVLGEGGEDEGMPEGNADAEQDRTPQNEGRATRQAADVTDVEATTETPRRDTTAETEQPAPAAEREPEPEPQRSAPAADAEPTGRTPEQRQRVKAAQMEMMID